METIAILQKKTEFNVEERIHHLLTDSVRCNALRYLVQTSENKTIVQKILKMALKLPGKLGHATVLMQDAAHFCDEEIIALFYTALEREITITKQKMRQNDLVAFRYAFGVLYALMIIELPIEEKLDYFFENCYNNLLLQRNIVDVGYDKISLALVQMDLEKLECYCSLLVKHHRNEAIPVLLWIMNTPSRRSVRDFLKKEYGYAPEDYIQPKQFNELLKDRRVLFFSDSEEVLQTLFEKQPIYHELKLLSTVNQEQKIPFTNVVTELGISSQDEQKNVTIIELRESKNLLVQNDNRSLVRNYNVLSFFDYLKKKYSGMSLPEWCEGTLLKNGKPSLLYYLISDFHITSLNEQSEIWDFIEWLKNITLHLKSKNNSDFFRAYKAIQNCQGTTAFLSDQIVHSYHHFDKEFLRSLCRESSTSTIWKKVVEQIRDDEAKNYEVDGRYGKRSRIIKAYYNNIQRKKEDDKYKQKIKELNTRWMYSRCHDHVYFNSLKFLAQTTEDIYLRKALIKIFSGQNLVLAAATVNGIYNDTISLENMVSKALKRKWMKLSIIIKKVLNDVNGIIYYQQDFYNLIAALLIFRKYKMFQDFMNQSFCPFIRKKEESIRTSMLSIELETEEMLMFFISLAENNIEERIPAEMLCEILSNNYDSATMHQLLQLLYQKNTYESIELLIRLTSTMSTERLLSIIGIDEKTWDTTILFYYSTHQIRIQRINAVQRLTLFGNLSQSLRELYQRNTTASLWDMMEIAQEREVQDIARLIKVPVRHYKKRISNLIVTKHCNFSLYLYAKYGVLTVDTLTEKQLHYLANDPDTELIEDFYGAMMLYIRDHKELPVSFTEKIFKRLAVRCGMSKEAEEIATESLQGTLTRAAKCIIRLQEMPSYVHDFGVQIEKVSVPNDSLLEILQPVLKNEQQACAWIEMPANQAWHYDCFRAILEPESVPLFKKPAKFLSEIFDKYCSPENMLRIFLHSPLRFHIEFAEFLMYLQKRCGSYVLQKLLDRVVFCGRVSSITTSDVQLYPYAFRCSCALRLDPTMESIRYQGNFYSPTVGDTLFFFCTEPRQHQKIKIRQPSFLPPPHYERGI